MENADHLAHHGDEGGLWLLAGGAETAVKRFERRVETKATRAAVYEEIDERMHAFLDRPLAGEWPYLWLDATHLTQREGGCIVSSPQ
jgi:transposase-like protein